MLRTRAGSARRSGPPVIWGTRWADGGVYGTLAGAARRIRSRRVSILPEPVHTGRDPRPERRGPDALMPEARAMNVAIFLNDVNEFNGPLMFIPGSHRLGVLEAQHDTSTTSYPLWVINHDTIRTLVERGGIVAPKGPAGSMILFH